MRSISLTLNFAATSLALLLLADPAHAQATRTWVSGVGDDVNPCSRTAPCKTFAGAISKTAVNGEINCLDPGGFGAITITKSITIDCTGTIGSVLNSGTNGVNIPFDSFNAADVRKTVRLRNLSINGANTGLTGIRITGGTVITAGVVIIDNVLVDGDFGGSAIGILDDRRGGGELHISNTTVQNVGTFGIQVGPGGSVAAQRIDATLDNVTVQNAQFGAVFAAGARALVNRSVFSGHSQSGVAVGSPSVAVQVNISNSAISNNGTGITNGANGTVRLANNDIAFNTTALSGATQSYNNNRIDGNGSLGTAPTVISLR